jgi:hypothetical protein
MRQTLVFFRDDDVGEMSDALRGVMQTLVEASIPCNYQVVPEYLDAAAAVQLRALQTAHPDLIFLNQHGFRHAQELAGQRVASEFAGGRPYDSQFRDIQQGREMLIEALGDSFAGDVFTPPCHKYDGETVRAIGDLGFTTLSAGVHADWKARAYYGLGRALGRIELLGRRVSYHLAMTPDPRVSEVSVSIDVHEAQDAAGSRVDKTAEDLWRELSFLRARLPAVGVMLHHQACDTAEKQGALREFVARLCSDPTFRIVRMSDLQ